MADDSVDEVSLQGTVNMAISADQIRDLLQEVRRVLRPGGSVELHNLTADRAVVDRPQLAGSGGRSYSVFCSPRR